MLYEEQQNEIASLVKWATPIINSLNYICTVKDRNSRYVACSEKFLSFIQDQRRNVIGNNDSNFIWKDCASIYQEIDSTVLAQKRKISSIVPIPVKDNKVVFSNTIKSPIKSNNGRVIGIFKHGNLIRNENILNSIRFLQQLDKGLFHQSYELRGYLLENTYHEINVNPLESLCLFFYVRGLTAKTIFKIVNLDESIICDTLDALKEQIIFSSPTQLATKMNRKKILYTIPCSIDLRSLYLIFNSGYTHHV